LYSKDFASDFLALFTFVKYALAIITDYYYDYLKVYLFYLRKTQKGYLKLF